MTTLAPKNKISQLGKDSAICSSIGSDDVLQTYLEPTKISYLMIKLSTAAAQEIARMQKSQDKLDSYLRLKVKQGGCSGLFYCLELESKPNFKTEPNEARNLSDRYFESQGISVIVDEKSFSYIEDMQLDYAEDLMGGGFRFQNPQAIVSCGCGISFATEKN